ncbi:MAG: hypothetical protein RL078_823 [Bacteroidota bacterium]|jgi:hypothetical protein
MPFHNVIVAHWSERPYGQKDHDCQTPLKSEFNDSRVLWQDMILAFFGYRLL